MRGFLVALALVYLTAPVRAERNIGIVVAGEGNAQSAVSNHLEKTLRKRGYEIVDNPLSKDALNTFVNCFVLDDLKCAHGVFEARSKTGNLIYTNVVRQNRDITFEMYWFVRGHEAFNEQRVCENCDAAQWHQLADTMLGRLAGASKVVMGTLELTSEPAGLDVVLDDVEIGKTPLEHEVPAGMHTIKLRHAGRTADTRKFKIERGETKRVAMKVEIEEPIDERSRLGAGVLLGAGVATIAAGGVFLYYASLGGVTEKYVYPDSKPVGIALCAVGGAAAIGGAILLFQASKSRSGPVASAGPSGAYLGWVSRF